MVHLYFSVMFIGGIKSQTGRFCKKKFLYLFFVELEKLNIIEKLKNFQKYQKVPKIVKKDRKNDFGSSSISLIFITPIDVKSIEYDRS